MLRLFLKVKNFAKTVENFLKERKEFETNIAKPFGIEIFRQNQQLIKARVFPNQGIVT